LIYGIGIDILEIKRVSRLIEKYGDKFIDKVYTEKEQERSKKYSTQLMKARHYAKRFAAKEAVSKALGTGFYNGVSYKKIGVYNLTSGKPEVELLKNLPEKLKSIAHDAKIDISITDEAGIAEAIAIISN
jgi:holo-[acyl-carrier protein] synthase